MGNDIFKALGDPTRRQILELLAKKGDMAAGDIAACFSISAPSVSHHLSVLKKADLVTAVACRQSLVYSLNTTAFQGIVQWLYTVFEVEEKAAEACNDPGPV